MKSVIFLSPVKYDALYQRHQSFAQLLAKKGIKVFFIEPFLGQGLSCSLINKKPELQILQIKVPFVAREYAALQNFAARIAAKLAYRVIKSDWYDSVFWIAEPATVGFVGSRTSPIIYDRCDRHGCFPGQRVKNWQKYEQKLFKIAQYVIVSHPQLLKDIDHKYRKKTILAGNATVFDPSNNNRKSLQGRATLNIISAGAHFEWTNFNWLAMLARNKSIHLHIAGTGRGQHFTDLIKHKNVTFHNALDTKRLEKLYHQCDVGVVPFIESTLTEAVDPIKVYDYAAMGLRIWAPDIKGLKDNKLIDACFNDPERLDCAIADITKIQPTDKIIPTWNDRLERILDITCLLG